MIVIIIISLHMPGTVANTLILSLKILIMTLYSKHYHVFLLKKKKQKNLLGRATWPRESLDSQPGIKPMLLHWKRSLNHWTTGEVLKQALLSGPFYS